MSPSFVPAPDPYSWTRIVRDVGFPAFIALVMLWQMIFQVPKEFDKVVRRLEAMEQAYAAQSRALLDLLTERRK